MKGGWKVYLTLFLLIILVSVFPYKEGFSNDMFSLSWFTTKEKQDVNGVDVDDKNETKNTKYVFNDKYGSGLLYTDIPYDASYNHYKFNNLSTP
jgi:hypothetical protein